MRFNIYGLISTTEQLRSELHKSEIVLTASTLLVVKAINKYWNTIKMHKTMEAELSHYTAFRNSVSPHKDMH